ncbi:hypothetical protein [Erythrobacter sp. MTPC3]|uniref:hypothetical protein n=1 Tax=Erythrobacter sp. MTPC3 TaxID=3056564 RepID=UPI0036F290F2
MSAFRTTKTVFCYLVAGYYFDRRELVVARKWMDRSMVYAIKDFPYISANNAILLLLEDRHSEARLWFKKCHDSLLGASNANHVYLRQFCEYYLASYGDRHRLPALGSIKARALELKADEWLRRRFRFPSSQAIESLVSKDHRGDVTGRSSSSHKVDISFEL